MDSPLNYDDFEVGQKWVSPRRTVTESDVIGFANMTGDHNPLHVDFDFAAKSHYRQPVAHGLLGMSWVAGLGSHFPNVNTLAFVAVRDWEFQRPIYFGDTVYVETVCKAKTVTGRRTGKVTWLRTLINHRSQVVQQGIFETLVSIELKPKQAKPQKPHFSQADESSNAGESVNAPTGIGNQ
ncbi:MAG: acyl dehydratase [Mariniblastus sp.]|nr:acyl dehydratase [Mariniblastus sp.]